MFAAKKKIRFWSMTLSGNTMIELLIVMIISGIVFLMAFEGLDIIRKYGALLNRRLTSESTLLYSHQTLEILITESDSIRKNNQELFFYSDNTVTKRLIVAPERSILLCQDSVTDELFPQLLYADYHLLNDSTDLVDSIFVTVKLGKDTLRFDYGLLSSYYMRLNIFSE